MGEGRREGGMGGSGTKGVREERREAEPGWREGRRNQLVNSQAQKSMKWIADRRTKGEREERKE